MHSLLREAAQAGIQFQANGDKLQIKAPPGAMTESLKQGIVKYKQDILTLLQTSGLADEVQKKPLTTDAANRHQPFPLTDLQHAYWVGRQGGIEMGNVATHLYVELACPTLDMARLERALRQLIETQDMLRAVVDHDGQQRILASVPNYCIEVTDCHALTTEQQNDAVQRNRDLLSHQVVTTDTWPLFDIRATRLSDSGYQLHISLDLLILDAWSLFLFFRDWQHLYQHPEETPAPLAISFRDYVLAEQDMLDSDKQQRAQDYWLKRIDALPDAPELPLKASAFSQEPPRFTRREARMPADSWSRLKDMGRKQGLTPSTLLLTAFSSVLERWSHSSHFSLNVTLSNRLQVHDDVSRLYGDFTTPVVHEVDHRDPGQSFLERAQAQQKRFAQDLEHKSYSGIQVMREMAKRRNQSLQAIMPVVFSSGLIWNGEDEIGDMSAFGNKVYSISQTSQVWLDHHVMEVGGELAYNWDAFEKAFEEGVLDAMFASYQQLLEDLLNQSDTWHSCAPVGLPPAQQQRRESANQTQISLPQGTLHAGFVANALATPEQLAIIAPDRQLTYNQLLTEACALANDLLEQGLQPGELVAVLMHKGWQQLVAVYGILLAKGAYLPINASLPNKRQTELLDIGEVRQVVLADSFTPAAGVLGARVSHQIKAANGAPFAVQHKASLTVDLKELAYVIFTSGTTGTPKGVMISHAGAVNTIEDINQRFQISAQDKVLAVSSLSFDLSVYDIFGLHGAGGTVVIPDFRKGQDAAHWQQLIQQHQISVWNSAPQLMGMLADSLIHQAATRLPLQTVLLSGDWIPLELPDRIHSFAPQAHCISLGGATEASIWSIYYPIQQVQPHWRSIPYGKALANQQMWVLDQHLRPCPDHVKGRIFIGGQGLACGYWRDVEKTQQKFPQHPAWGSRIYDTGDLGRYAEDGQILMLGRDDNQIKLRGHRIELGEIESILLSHPDIKGAVVDVIQQTNGRKQLVAFLLPSVSPQSTLAQEVMHWLADYLPDYMIPGQAILIDHIPVSNNGKVDRAQLKSLLEMDAAEQEGAQPTNATEQTLLTIWSQLMPDYQIGIHDNFFELGGDSVLATRLVTEINRALHMDLEMHELFENLTIQELAQLYQQRPQAATINHNSDESRLLADIVEVTNGFDRLNFAPPQNTQHPPQQLRSAFVTGASGWIGRHLLAHLLTTTEASLFCLVRQGTSVNHLLDQLKHIGVEPQPDWHNRIKVMTGDLQQDKLGLSAQNWHQLSTEAEVIYHLGANLNVMADYQTLAKENVLCLDSIVSLATEQSLKPVFMCSPMTVCRRHSDAGLSVWTEESCPDTAAGLMTGYAQSKWAVEQIMLNAAQRGLPIKLYRTSHALPAAKTGLCKTGDTYSTLFKAAVLGGLVPEWQDSAVPGLPVDRLCATLVRDSLTFNTFSGLMHIENPTPTNFSDVTAHLLERKEMAPSLTPLQVWKDCCANAAEHLLGSEATLVQQLLAGESGQSPVERMFTPHAFSLERLQHYHGSQLLSDLTPATYWQTVGQRLRQQQADSSHQQQSSRQEQQA